jgi:hypothetical protein
MEWLRLDIYCEQDAKIKILLKRFGYEGFGLYWSLILYLANEDGSINHEVAIETLAHTWRVDEVEASKWIDRFLEIGLIYEGEAGLQSNRLWAEIDRAAASNKQRSGAGNASGVSRRAKAGLPPVVEETNDQRTAVQLETNDQRTAVQLETNDQRTAVQLETNDQRTAVQLDVNGVPEKTNTDLQTYIPTDLQKDYGASADADTPSAPVSASTKQQKYTPDFEQFWSAYPARPNNPKKLASSRWLAAKKRAGLEEIGEGLARYAAYCDAQGITGTDKVAQAATWLNQERWSDSYDATPTDKSSRGIQVIQAAGDRIRQREEVAERLAIAARSTGGEDDEGY